MFLSLELPGGDKGITIFVHDLAGDEDFDHSNSFHDWNSDRARADYAIKSANRALGKQPFEAFISLFNQFSYSGTTGWEYWSDDYQLVLKHALMVAEALSMPLHVHVNVTDQILDAAIAANIQFDFSVAKPVEQPNTKDFSFVNKQIENEEYFVLTDVTMPESVGLHHH